jgi:hypothetical protein
MKLFHHRRPSLKTLSTAGIGMGGCEAEMVGEGVLMLET